MTEPPNDPLEFRLFNEIGIVEQLARARFERVLPHDLTLAQFGVLNHFARLGGDRSLVRLAGAFQVTKAAMTNIVGKLVAKRLVKVVPDPQDGRGKRVSLTEKGLAARNAAIAALVPQLRELSAAFPRADIEAILPPLTRLRIWLDTHR